jgi:hypothetical protein
MEHTTMIATRVSALALAAVLGVSAVASAQSPPGQGYPPQPPQARADWGERREAREAAHFKALHDALNIRPDQEAAFQAFAAASTSPENGAKPDGMRAERQQMATMTTPERLDAMSRRMDERMERMRDRFQRRAAAVKAFYAALGPDQRRTFDALPQLAGGGMGMGHGWARGGRDGHGPMGRPGMGQPPGQGE